MSARTKPTPRLGRQDWINAAIEELAAAGIGSVSIENLASRLEITRGSFYHHFSDRQELLQAMLGHWAEEWTYSVRDQVAALGLDPGNTLLVLLRTIRSNRAAELDAPIRAWALHDDMAREVLAKVDEARMGIIHEQFLALGFAGLEAENRARLFLYYEIASPSFFFRHSAEDQDELLLERHRFLTTARVEQEGEE
jgi:AcrR family transcriptional regulator